MKKKAKRIAKIMRNASLETEGRSSLERFNLYTDGSCKDGAGGCAWIVEQDGIILKIGKKRIIGHCDSSVRAELLGIMQGLEECPKNSLIDVYSDCQAAIGKITAGKLGDLNAIYNKVSCSKTIRYHWGKAHSGNMYNEMVDSLSFSVSNS